MVTKWSEIDGCVLKSYRIRNRGPSVRSKEKAVFASFQAVYDYSHTPQRKLAGERGTPARFGFSSLNKSAKGAIPARMYDYSSHYY